MKIKNAKTLDKYRGPGTCELCQRICQHREPHHVVTRGGNGSDVDVNLVALGSTPQWECECHRDVHSGKIGKETLIEIIAKRHNTTPDTIAQANYALVALDKEGSDASLKRHVSWRSPEIKQLVYEALAGRTL